jgi:hypothetical protein
MENAKPFDEFSNQRGFAISYETFLGVVMDLFLECVTIAVTSMESMIVIIIVPGYVLITASAI